jgi:hypothetical protein
MQSFEDPVLRQISNSKSEEKCQSCIGTNTNSFLFPIPIERDKKNDNGYNITFKKEHHSTIKAIQQALIVGKNVNGRK